jgi:SMI1 / KNR4 family (SUKH-1)
MNLEKLNINVNGKPSLGFNGNDLVIKEIEALIGFALPKSYFDFINKADGGHPEVGTFYPKGSSLDNSFSVDWFYSLTNPNVENIKSAIKDWGDVLGKQTLPIGRDAGGNQIYLAVDKSGTSVWLLLHDENDTRVKLADSLEEFVSGLTINPDFI